MTIEAHLATLEKKHFALEEELNYLDFADWFNFLSAIWFYWMSLFAFFIRETIIFRK